MVGLLSNWYDERVFMCDEDETISVGQICEGKFIFERHNEVYAELFATLVSHMSVLYHDFIQYIDVYK